KAPVDQRTARLLRNGDDQKRRHCDVVGEMNEGVRQASRQVARIANNPSGQDHCKYRQYEVSYPQSFQLPPYTYEMLHVIMPSLRLQINCTVAGGLCTTNEEIALGRFFERLRLAGNTPRNQPALTVVANAGSARPADGNIAGLGKFQNILISGSAPPR